MSMVGTVGITEVPLIPFCDISKTCAQYYHRRLCTFLPAVVPVISLQSACQSLVPIASLFPVPLRQSLSKNGR